MGKIQCTSEIANKIRGYYIKTLDAQNTIGTGLVSTFAPYCLPLVPAAKKIAKDGRLAAFDFVAKKVVKEDERGYYGGSDTGLNDEEQEQLNGNVVDFLNNIKGGKTR